MEQHSLHNVYQLVVRCCECVSLWRILCEGNMSLTAEKLVTVSVIGQSKQGEGGRGENGGRSTECVGRGKVEEREVRIQC